jgi:hypothetical protein
MFKFILYLNIIINSFSFLNNNFIKLNYTNNKKPLITIIANKNRIIMETINKIKNKELNFLFIDKKFYDNNE